MGLPTHRCVHTSRARHQPCMHALPLAHAHAPGPVQRRACARLSARVCCTATSASRRVYRRRRRGAAAAAVRDARVAGPRGADASVVPHHWQHEGAILPAPPARGHLPGLTKQPTGAGSVLCSLAPLLPRLFEPILRKFILRPFPWNPCTPMPPRRSSGTRAMRSRASSTTRRCCSPSPAAPPRAARRCCCCS
jgi:hypothetical protein